MICAACGQENPEGFSFCGRCGGALAAEPTGEVRKTVTVLFCDLVGSTALGERGDPEVLRELMARYHAELRSIVEGHGGTVEKFAGDAVLAVFGIPQLHEDDALRGARAAIQMRTAVGALALEVHIGVNTGEVMAGGGETLVIGDAINVAAAMEHARAAGDLALEVELVRVSAPPIIFGAVPVEEGFRYVDRILDRLGDIPAVRAFGLHVTGHLRARLGEFDAARRDLDEWRSRFCELGQNMQYASTAACVWDVCSLAGDCPPTNARFAKATSGSSKWARRASFRPRRATSARPYTGRDASTRPSATAGSVRNSAPATIS